MPAIYKIKKKGYLLHADRKAVNGFHLAWKPFIQIAENDVTPDTMAIAIKEVIKESENEERVPNPKNWSENSKQFIKNMGLKSIKELYAETSRFCDIYKDKNNIVFTPTKHADPPDQSFVGKSKDEPNIIVSFAASNEEIFQAFKLALSRCE